MEKQQDNLVDFDKKIFENQILNNPDLLERLYRQHIREQEHQEKLEKANPKFVQVTNQNLPAIQKLIAKNSLAGGIFFFFCENMNNNNSVACSSKVIEDYFDSSRMSVYRAIKLLKERNFISTSKMGNINVYHLNEKLVWKKEKDKRKYAKFSATIILSEEEQISHKKVKSDMKKMNVILEDKDN